MGPSARCSPHVVIVSIKGDGLKCAKSGIEQGSWVRGATSSEVREGCVNMVEDRGSKVGCEPKSWGMADLGRCRNWCWGGEAGPRRQRCKVLVWDMVHGEVAICRPEECVGGTNISTVISNDGIVGRDFLDMC